MNPFFLAGCVLGGGLVLYLLSLGIAFGGVPENIENKKGWWSF